MKNLSDKEVKFINGGNDWIGQCDNEPEAKDPSSYYGEGSPYNKFGKLLGNIVMLGFSLTTLGKIIK